MFERQKYKQFAKIQLKDRIGLPVLITLIILAITFLFSLLSSLMGQAYTSGDSFSDSMNFYRFFEIYSRTSGAEFFLSIASSIVEVILTFGSINMYLKMSRSPNPVSFSDFTEGLAEFGRAILAFLWQLLWITLWSMLFIIPGIIKSYEYSMIYYIASEYKNVSVIDAMNISKTITKGHKWDLFVMDLSFLGWILLSVISCGVGFLWIIPYMTMTEINAYHAILKEAIENGTLAPEDLKRDADDSNASDASADNEESDSNTAKALEDNFTKTDSDADTNYSDNKEASDSAYSDSDAKDDSSDN